jgi:hypothetical protein
MQPIIEELKAQGFTTERAICAELNAQAIPTAQAGGKWHNSSVHRLLKKLYSKAPALFNARTPSVSGFNTSRRTIRLQTRCLSLSNTPKLYLWVWHCGSLNRIRSFMSSKVGYFVLGYKKYPLLYPKICWTSLDAKRHWTTIDRCASNVV